VLPKAIVVFSGEYHITIAIHNSVNSPEDPSQPCGSRRVGVSAWLSLISGVGLVNGCPMNLTFRFGDFGIVDNSPHDKSVQGHGHG
jgi:hypothetical protein